MRTGAMRVSSILVDNTEHPTAGILTPGSARAVRLPDIQLVSGVLLDGVLPGHSGGTVPESHRLPCTAGLPSQYIVGRPSKSTSTEPVLSALQVSGGGFGHPRGRGAHGRPEAGLAGGTPEGGQHGEMFQ
jgi:hypothetical protein